jgi:hypothetical protein
MPLSQTWFYKFIFAFTAIAFMDPTSLLSSSEYTVPIKQLYTLIVVAFVIFYGLSSRSFLLESAAPVLALLFFIITGCVFIINLIVFGYKQSILSEFISSLIFAAAIVIPQSGIVIDIQRILKQLFGLFLFCSTCYLFETIFKHTDFGAAHSFNPDSDFPKSILSVLGLCLAILLRRNVMIVLFLAVMLTALVFRPTSTLVLATAFTVPLTILLRGRAIGLSRTIAYGILIAAVSIPLIIYAFFDEIGRIIMAMESAIKSDVLGDVSNTQIRLLIIKEAIRQLSETSYWYGRGLDGNATIFIGREASYWFHFNPQGLIAIHSDFVVILSQAGIVGYSVFFVFFYSILHFRFRSLTKTGAHNNGLYNLLSLSIVACVCLIIFCSANPILYYYYVVHPVWAIFLISQLAGRAKLVSPPSSSVESAATPRAKGFHRASSRQTRAPSRYLH